MAFLHNRINNKELREAMLAETTPRTTVSFYKYFSIEAPQLFRDELFLRLQEIGIFGRIYVAGEGINAQVSVPQDAFEKLREILYSYPQMQGMRLNIAVDDDGKSFWVLKIKVRPKIVADGIEDPEFNPANTGEYLDAAAFNNLVQQGNAVLVDMRNHYEYEVGHFEGALEVPSDTFREQLPMAVDMLSEVREKPVIMYCTGGIRCEKASAYFKQQGFQNVFHLEGGIIEYTRQAREQGLPLLFKGKNFVFDARLGERISEDVIAHCHQCGASCDDHTNCAYDGCHLLFIQCPACRQKMDGCCSAPCQEAQAAGVVPTASGPASAVDQESRLHIFNKSKSRLRPLRGKGLGHD
jgi:UPF0176 protein